MLIKSKRQELEGGRNLCRGKDGSRGDEGLPEGAAVGGGLCGTEHFAGEGGEEYSLHSAWLFDFFETKAGYLKCDVLFLSRLSSFSGGSGGMIQGHLDDL